MLLHLVLAVVVVFFGKDMIPVLAKGAIVIVILAFPVVVIIVSLFVFLWLWVLV